MVSTPLWSVTTESDRYKSLHSDKLKRVLPSTARVRRQTVHMKAAAAKNRRRKQRGKGNRCRRRSSKSKRLLEDEHNDEQTPKGVEHPVVSLAATLLTARHQKKKAGMESDNPQYKQQSRQLFCSREMSSVQIEEYQMIPIQNRTGKSLSRQDT